MLIRVVKDILGLLVCKKKTQTMKQIKKGNKNLVIFFFFFAIIAMNICRYMDASLIYNNCKFKS